MRSSLIIFLCSFQFVLSSRSWFGFFDDDSKEDGNKEDGEQQISEDMVSPIVNRELEASVIAHDWPFIVDNVYCEAWAYHQQKNWDFMDNLVNILTGGDGKAATVEQATQQVLDSTEKKDLTLLEYSLSLRAHSPLCELHRTLARNHVMDDTAKLGEKEAFCVIPQQQNKLVTTTGELREALKENFIRVEKEFEKEFEKELLLPDENFREYSDNGNNDLPLVILYANMGSKSFTELYQVLVDAKARFLVRHRGHVFYEEVGGTATALQGYGVRLDIKNIEYKVFDDRTLSEGENEASLVNTSSLEDLTDHTLAGVKISDLNMPKEEKLKLQSELWKIHEAQQTHSQLIPPKWQRRELSLQAATAISQSSSDVLLTLQDISQNLPSAASTLVHVSVPEELSKLADSMESVMRRGNGVALTINGRKVLVGRPSFNVFELINTLREEQDLLQKMQKKLQKFLSIKGLKLVQKAWSLGEDYFMGKEADDDDEGMDQESGLSGSARRIDVGRGWKGSILYVNDVEKDSMYKRWPRSLQAAMMNMQFGAPPSVRRNLFTILCVIDPIAEDALDHDGFQLSSQLMRSGYPLRLGHLLVNNSDLKKCKSWIRDNNIEDSNIPCPTDPILDRATKITSLSELPEITASTHAVHRLVAEINKKYAGEPTASSFVEYFFQQLQQYDGSLTLGELVRTFAGVLQSLDAMQMGSSIKFAIDTLQKDDDDDEDASTYGKALRFAVEHSITPGMGFLNGRPLTTKDDPGKIFMEEQNHIFGLIMKGEITDNKPKSVYGRLLTGDNVYPRLHPLLSDTVDNPHLEIDHGLSTSSLLKPSTLQNAEHEGLPPDAVFVVEAVVNTEDIDTSIKFLSNFINIMDSYPSTMKDGSFNLEVSIGYRMICAPSSDQMLPPLCHVLANAGAIGTEIIKLILSKQGIAEMSLDEVLNSFPDINEATKAEIVSSLMSIPGNDWPTEVMPSNNFVSVNGKFYNPEEVTKDDIELLISMELSRSKASVELLQDHLVFNDENDKNYFEAVSKVSAFLANQFSDSSGDRLDMVHEVMKIEEEEGFENNPFRFSWNMDDKNEDQLRAQVSVAVDPASKAAQRVAPFLLTFRDLLKLPLQMVLTPKAVVGDDNEIPFTSYYRFVADPKALQDVRPPHASFSNLPTNHILTLRMDVPESWNIQQTRTVQDTDNLRCDIQAGCSDKAHGGTDDPKIPMQDKRQLTSVEYGLKNLLIFGQCYDATKKTPPNGLQLTLSRGNNNGGPELIEEAEVSVDGTIEMTRNSEDTHYSDTLVMKTVGYWQLRANPGKWHLNIAPESRGAEIFDMVDGSVNRGGIKLSDKQVDNSKKTIYVRDFTAKSDILLVKRRKGMEKESLFYEDEKLVNSSDDETIHVFSLATGHLYERFLKIMMLSVTKRTSMKVKFWLFENYLSPTFKASAEAMSRRIGCEVEFVTYKWPEFLRGQSVKQRIIWGYKILFLDVLFPLNVKKIIYVDADQVVRGDLKELWEMDLKGAPYGYTPMCSSRESTLGYQFWRGGFWESHLRGKPYHISALYVVDLAKFRKNLVGDNLRSTYQQLSADPNSLANLDQDLPNYAQHQVPIFSLPQEWLWCESWCSDESKVSAKTIDLCNNPLHKEPKVSMAKRIISGDLFQESWIELDAEVEGYDKEYFDSLS